MYWTTTISYNIFLYIYFILNVIRFVQRSNYLLQSRKMSNWTLWLTHEELNNQQCHNQRIHLSTKHLQMYFYQVSCSIPFSMYTHAVTFVKLEALWKGYVVYCTRVPIHLFSLPPNITFTTRRSDDWTINPALDHCQT